LQLPALTRCGCTAAADLHAQAPAGARARAWRPPGGLRAGSASRRQVKGCRKLAVAVRIDVVCASGLPARSRQSC